VLWGAYHGLFLVLERIFLQKFYTNIGKLPSTILTFIIVAIGWVFFRVEKISDAFIYVRQMFAFNFKSTIVFDTEFKTFFMIAVFFAFFTYSLKGQAIQDSVYGSQYTVKRHYLMSFVVILLMILSISSITAFGFNPFIYFRF
jgi:alginate O-acetyltransferase complex protein AlgI